MATSVDRVVLCIEDVGPEQKEEEIKKKNT